MIIKSRNRKMTVARKRRCDFFAHELGALLVCLPTTLGESTHTSMRSHEMQEMQAVEGYVTVRTKDRTLYDSHGQSVIRGRVEYACDCTILGFESPSPVI
jgi:hypothetical protein